MPNIPQLQLLKCAGVLFFLNIFEFSTVNWNKQTALLLVVDWDLGIPLYVHLVVFNSPMHKGDIIAKKSVRVFVHTQTIANFYYPLYSCTLCNSYKVMIAFLASHCVCYELYTTFCSNWKQITHTDSVCDCPYLNGAMIHIIKKK